MRGVRWLVVAAAAVFSSLLPPAAGAQSLAQLLPRLLSESVTMPSSVPTAPGQVIPGNPHEAHFLPDAAQQAAPYALNTAVVSQLATFPLGSSSGGFTYTFDEATGVPSRSSGNFGPAFAERALTQGKHRFSWGFTFQRVQYDQFEGLDLQNGPITFYLRHNECCLGQSPSGTPAILPPVPTEDEYPSFEGDLVKDQLSLKATTETGAFLATFGLTDRVDVGVVVPIVKVTLDGTMFSTILRLGSSNNPDIHSFGPPDPDHKTTSEHGSATGLGDIALRAKANLMRRPGGGLALGVDLRLPTGDEKNLLGTGATQLRPYLIWSQDFGRVSPHLNAGYTASFGQLSAQTTSFDLGDEAATPTLPTAQDPYTTVSGGSGLTSADVSRDVPDEINYTGGLVVSAHPRLSLSVDVIGRTLRNVPRFGLMTQSFPYRLVTDPAPPAPPARHAEYQALDITSAKGNMTLLLGAAGLKWNVASRLLLNVNVLFPLNDQGLRPGVTPAFSFDYTF